jgi:hypothetical protein
MGPTYSTTSAQQSAPGFFLLAWGIFATVIGWGLATNFRGFTDRFTHSAYVSSSWMRRIPPWKWMHRGTDAQELASRVKLSRLIAIPFAILGPIVTVAGVVQMARGHIAVPRGPVLPLPFALAFIGVGVLAVVQYWRRGGLFRLAARQSAWMRAAAIVASLGAVSFGVFTALGFTTLGVAGWLAGGLASVPLVISRKSTPVPPHTSAPAQPGEPLSSAGPDEDDDASAYRWL